MSYVKIAKADDVKDGEKKKISVQDKEILLTNVKGKYYAINNKCPHMGGSLSDGNLDGYSITCPRHGSVFDVRTGESTKEAKMAFMKIKVNDTPAYPVKVEGKDILIDIG